MKVGKMAAAVAAVAGLSYGGYVLSGSEPGGQPVAAALSRAIESKESQ